LSAFLRWFQLFVAQQVGLVDHEDGGAAALVALGGQDGGGLGGQPGAGAVWLPAEGRDDGLVQAADADPSGWAGR
jgi:hypothetical protein